jgi:nucleotide-binding universal stress UspA family protein
MPQLAFPMPRVGYATSAPTPELEEQWIAAARDTVTRAAQWLDDAGFATKTQAVLGAPAARVLAEAQETQADLVVVGSRGLGAVERAAFGSVSDQVVREAAATLVGRRAN